MNKEEASCVVGAPGVNSQQITKTILNFKEKAWLTLARHRLCPIIMDNVLSPVCIAFIIGVMAGYKFSVAQFITREIYVRAVCTDVLLVFPYLLTQTFLDSRVPKIQPID